MGNSIHINICYICISSLCRITDKVIWDEERIYFPIENGDWSVLIENQRVSKIKFKRLSAQYKDSLAFIVLEALNTSDSNVRKAMKIIERGV